MQYCTITMGPEGMVVRWEVDSKTLQSFVFMKPAV